MIVVQAKESKKSNDLAQLLLGTKSQEKSRFSDILALVERAKSGVKEGNGEALKLLIGDDVQELQTPLQTFVSLKKSPADSNASRADISSGTAAEGQAAQNKSVQPKNQKEQMLALLLSGAPELIEEGDSAESLNALLEPKVVAQLDEKTLKSTLIRAKQQLRTQIETVVKEQQIEIKTMPQSLKGLYDLAQKLQINVEKITLETLQVKTESAVGVAVMRLPILVRQERTAVPQASALRSALERTSQKDEGAQESDDQPLKKLLSGATQVTKSQQSASSITPDAPLQRQTLADEAPLLVKSDLKAVAAASTQPHALKGDTESIASVAPSAPQPLQSAESVLKGAPLEEKLASLLFGESESVEGEKSTAVSTPAEPKAVTTVASVGADALEVKVKEAQQTVRHFATELREAVENYKPPFTRLKITLNPAKLGEVDVTMIQRGNNVHINVSSNSAALNLLAHNVAELKTQLANNGVVNTTMQFSTAHGEHQQQGQQQRSQTFAQSYRPLEALSEEELERITSIEITLPRYA